MSKPLRIAFVTIGETPRIDVVPEMIEEILMGHTGRGLDYLEFGVLDGLSDADVDTFRAEDGEASFATRRKSGEEIVTSKHRTEARLNLILKDIDQKGFDLIVLLCTGTTIEPLQNTLVVEAQRIVDSTVEALAASCKQLGLILPLERQVKEFAERHVFSGTPKAIGASPYAGDDIRERALALKDCDLVVMHCMGYSAKMLTEARASITAPVLLSRRMVAGVIRQML